MGAQGEPAACCSCPGSLYTVIGGSAAAPDSGRQRAISGLSPVRCRRTPSERCCHQLSCRP
eukprot:scaffold21865_cov125-Isochrysis_galbana.AAC.4